MCYGRKLGHGQLVRLAGGDLYPGELQITRPQAPEGNLGTTPTLTASQSQAAKQRHPRAKRRERSF